MNDSVSSLLVLGCRDGEVYRGLSSFLSSGTRVYLCDVAQSILSQMSHKYCVVADDECMPFKNNIFDFVVSNLTLHNINDPVSVLSKICSMLRQEGVFLAATLGSNTLREVKKAIISAEKGKIIPRIQPFMSASEVLNILRSSGFKDVVVDVNTVEVKYNNLYHLFRDIKDTGEGNTFRKGSVFPIRDILDDAWNIYKRSISKEEEDYVPVQYEVLLVKGDKK